MGQNKIKSFRDLEVWNAGMELMTTAYLLAAELPDSERFALSAQVRRSAVSIPSNVAEGHARRGRAYRNHVLIALGSTAELETQLEAAVRLEFLTSAEVQAALDLIARVGQMLHGLERSLLRRNVALQGSGAVSLCATAIASLHILG